MSTDISTKCRMLIEKIFPEHDLEEEDIHYESESVSGEGFMSSNLRVAVKDKDKTLHLFCKANVMTTWCNSLSVDKMFTNEIYFYNTIYPAYRDFLKEKCIEDEFRNVPKCYGAEEDIIVLENIKLKGYDLFDKDNIMNDEHILFTMKTLGKFHAISFAFKDQKNELYNRFLQNVQSCFTDMMIEAGYDKTLTAEMRLFVRSLDPVEDKHLLDASGDMITSLNDAVLNVEKYPCNNPVIIHGDSWCNNMLYLYDDENQESPIDMMLVDWQVLRNGSPAFDLIYFFYFVASEAALDNLEEYLIAYYDELSKRIKQLGSDPEVLYPSTVLKEEWKKFAKYAFAQGFFVIKALVADKEEQKYFYEYSEIPNKVADTGEDVEAFIPKIKDEHLFLARMKLMLKHFIKHDFL